MHILCFPLICNLPACHISALKMIKIESQALHYLVYSINATFVTSGNTTKVRDLDVIFPRPSPKINAKRISTTRIYFVFFRGRNDSLNDICL